MLTNASLASTWPGVSLIALVVGVVVRRSTWTIKQTAPLNMDSIESQHLRATTSGPPPPLFASPSWRPALQESGQLGGPLAFGRTFERCLWRLYFYERLLAIHHIPQAPKVAARRSASGGGLCSLFPTGLCKQASKQTNRPTN